MKNIIAGSIVILLPLLAACERDSAGSARPDSAPPLPVAVEVVRFSEEIRHEAVPAQVRPVHTSVVSARIQGQVGQVHADPGKEVGRGEVLAVLVADELRARARRAQSELEAATLELERVRGLIESNAATPRELETAETRRGSAQAAADEAETFLDYTVVRAPFDGLVTRKHVEPGDLVSPGQPIVELQSPERFRLEAWTPESLARSLAPGEEIRFEIESVIDSGTGFVSEIEPSVDPATRTILVKVELPEDPGLRNGQYALMFFRSDEALRLTVPEGSVVKRGQLEYVYVVSGDPANARLRLIRTGARRDGRVEILAGLDGEETVVTEIPSGLRDGRNVEITQ